MKTYLITGAAGFIGSQFAKSLIDDDNRVVTIDNLSTGHIENIPDGVIFIKGDCSDLSTIEKVEGYNFDAIVHIAGQSSGEISFADPVYDLQTNTQSTLLLLNLALRTNCKKFIYASTMSVYGDSKSENLTSELEIKWSKSFYGVGKIASENYMGIYQDNYGIECIALRLFNVYGPGQNLHNSKQGMVSIFLQQALLDNIIHVKGSAYRYRDFVYIDDVVDAFHKSLSIHKPDHLMSINIGTGIKTYVGDLVKLITKLAPEKVSSKFEGNTPGDQFGIVADNSKAEKLLGWKPNVNLEEGLDKMMKWAIVKNELENDER